VKYIISESKLDNIIYNYINSIGEFMNLEEFDCSSFDWDLGHDVEEYCYQKEPYGDVQIEYFPHPEQIPTIISSEYGETLEYLPAVNIVDTDIKNELESLFGDRWEEPFKKWFKDKFDRNIKTLY